MTSKYITHELFHDIEEGKEKTKEAKRVYDNVLNYDMLEIIQDDRVYWTEKVYSSANIPEYAYAYIKKWAKKRVLTYLYDIKYMKKYTITMTRSEDFLIDVQAESLAEAKELAEAKFIEGDYRETGNLTTDITDITPNI